MGIDHYGGLVPLSLFRVKLPLGYSMKFTLSKRTWHMEVKSLVKLAIEAVVWYQPCAATTYRKNIGQEQFETAVGSNDHVAPAKRSLVGMQGGRRLFACPSTAKKMRSCNSAHCVEDGGPPSPQHALCSPCSASSPAGRIVGASLTVLDYITSCPAKITAVNTADLEGPFGTETNSKFPSPPKPNTHLLHNKLVIRPAL